MAYLNVRDNIQFWRDMGASSEVLLWIEEGAKFDFLSDPISYQHANRVKTPGDYTFIDSEVLKLLKNGAVSQVDYVPYCCSALFTVPKKNRKKRLVTDLHPLNIHIKTPYFKNDGIDTVCEMLEYDDRMLTIDLKDGFHHVPIHDDYKKFLGFQWKGIYYVWNVCPFGLSCSPYFFNKLIRVLVCHLRAENLRLNFWVDDAILMERPELAQDSKEKFMYTLEKAGIAINFDKSSLDLTVSKEYVGYIVSSVGKDDLPFIKIPSARVLKLRRDIKRALNSRTSGINARFLARICGQCISFTKAMLPAKLLLRNLYRVLRARESWNDVLFLDQPCVDDLLWWLEAFHSWNGRSIMKQVVEKQVFTDASGTGWGAACDNLEASGLWSSQMMQEHSNVKELMGVLLAIRSFKAYIAGKSVQIVSDNISSVAYINHLGGPCPRLSEIARVIFAEASALKVTLQARHLAGRLNLVADRLSRLTPNSTYSWSIHPGIFSFLDHVWGPHTCDRFADIMNHVCPKYNSLYHDPLTAGVDALAQQDWSQENNFVNPPFAMISRVLHVIQSQQAMATLIAPWWPGQTWFADLVKMAVRPPIRLPRSNLFWFRGRRPEPLKNPRWKMYAWRISGKIP